MKPFLSELASRLASKPSASVDRAFMINMHALDSVAELMEVFVEYGMPANDTMFIGKPYSTVPKAAQNIIELGIPFETAAQKFKAGTLVSHHDGLLDEIVPAFIKDRRNKQFILLDSGAHLTKIFDGIAADADRISVQLTSSGSRYFAENDKRLIDIGRFQMKRDGESKEVARVIMAGIRQKVPGLTTQKICVIGHGVIGKAVVQEFISNGVIPTQHLSGVDPTEVIFEDTDMVVGATGYDLSKLIERSPVKGKALNLFSCSSWDVEFQTIALETGHEIEFSLTSDAPIMANDGKWIIHNGGCPICFNRVAGGCDTGMAITRGLTLSAALNPQAFLANAPKVLQMHRAYYGMIG